MKCILCFLIGFASCQLIYEHRLKQEYIKYYTDGYQNRINYEHGN